MGESTPRDIGDGAIRRRERVGDGAAVFDSGVEGEYGAAGDQCVEAGDVRGQAGDTERSLIQTDTARSSLKVSSVAPVIAYSTQGQY